MKSTHVLVCDDEVHIVKPLQLKLERSGFRVSVAFDGQEAWTLMQRDKPDLLLTDCQMPVCDGFELCSRIRSAAEFAGMPIIMLTAKAFEYSQDEVRDEWGVCEIIGKPFSPRAIAERINELLEGQVAATDSTMTK